MVTKEEVIQEIREKNILDCQTLKMEGTWGHFNNEKKKEIKRKF